MRSTVCCFLFGIASLTAIACGSAANATTFASSATGVSAALSTNGVASLTASSPTTGNSSASAYNLNSGGASIYAGGSVAPDPLRVGSSISASGSSSGAVSAASSDGATVAQATFTTNGGQINLNQPSLGSLFQIGFNTLSSASSANLFGGSYLTSGSASISGLTASGSLLTAALAAADYNNVAANTVLVSLAGIKVILNEQIKIASADGASIQTNAIHVFYDGLSLGGGNLLSGDVVYGHTVAAISGAGAVPEPGTWLTMLAGFGLLGAAMRRRSPALAFD